MRPVRRILFVRTDRIGDVLMNLPAIRSLRLAYPKAWITLLTSSSSAELFRGHADLDEVMAVDEKHLTSFGALWGLFRQIQKAGFDLAVISNPSKLFHFMIWAAGIPVRAGHNRKAALFLNRRMESRTALLGLHEIERNLRLAERAGGKPWDAQIHLPVESSAKAWADGKMAPLLERWPGLIVVHPGTSHPKKRWPAERYGELSRRIMQELSRGVLLVGGAEESLSGRVITGAAPGVENWIGQTSLKELAALFNHPNISALVSSDSGPVHVAWIQGTPVVALYAMDLAGSDPMRWGPRDDVSEAIHRPMEAVTVDEVLAALRRVLVRPTRKGAV